MLEAIAEDERTDGIDCRCYVVAGDGAEAIVDVAERENADLIVVGNKGHVGSEAVPSRQRAERGLAPCTVQRSHRIRHVGRPPPGRSEIHPRDVTPCRGARSG